jgi:hypothetical protein
VGTVARYDKRSFHCWKENEIGRGTAIDYVVTVTSFFYLQYGKEEAITGLGVFQAIQK